MSQQLIDISVAEDGSVWGLAPGGAIVQVVPTPVAWTPISGQQLTSISATPDGALTGINTTGQIVQSTNGTTFQGLSTQLNNAAQISASDATTIWGLDAGGNVYAYSGSSWIYIGAGTAFIAAAADGSLWGKHGHGRPEPQVCSPLPRYVASHIF
jgi:virginiamycin B lyase